MGRFDSILQEYRESEANKDDNNPEGSSPTDDPTTEGQGTDPTNGDGNQDEGKQAEDQKKKADQNVPFHKHPRFVEINNKLKQATSDSQAKDAKIAELEAQLAEAKGTSQKKDLSEMSAEEYNEHILEEARRIAREEARSAKGEEKKDEKGKQPELTSILDQIGQEFDTIRDFDGNFSDQDEEAVIELCMKPPADLLKTLGGRENPTIREAYKYFKAKKGDKVPPDKKKQAEVRSGGSNDATDSDRAYKTWDDIKKAGMNRSFGG